MYLLFKGLKSKDSKVIKAIEEIEPEVEEHELTRLEFENAR